ncbi:MAG TPA: oligoendopeptidase, partial [Acidobacteriota bacterium]|nr:oligoendopeptidase [Acidobacteriota bacterium]
MASNSAEGIRWDLSDLFADPDDPHIESILKACLNQAGGFAEQFRPVMEKPMELTAAPLHQALVQLETIYEALGRVGSYASLLYAADTAKPEHQDLEQRVEQRSTEIRNLLLFFELAWLQAEDDVANKLINDPKLKSYEHYLKSLRRYRPHTLSELEEKLINEKDNTGRNAFGRLFSEVTSSLTFK